jgi:hypothetical protein
VRRWVILRLHEHLLRGVVLREGGTTILTPAQTGSCGKTYSSCRIPISADRTGAQGLSLRLTVKSGLWVIFRFADHPGVDRFGQHYRVFHALYELGGAKSIRGSKQ